MIEQDKNLKIVFFAGIVAITISLTVILGWVFDIALLKTMIPGYVSMKLNTALCFLFTATILILFLKNKWYNLTLFLSLVLTVFSLASLSQDIFGYNLGLDQLLIIDFDAIDNGETSPGRPSPTTSICFFLFGLVFIVFHMTNFIAQKIGQYALHLITLIAFIAFIAFLGYLFNVPTLYKLSFFTSMAIHTSAIFLMLSILVSFIHPSMGITGLFTGKKFGNFMARNLFVKILATVLILGYVQLLFGRNNLISIEFGIALFTTCFILVALYLLWSTAKLLNQIDTKRELAEKKLVLNNKNLENIVEERTGYLTKQNKQLEDFAHIVSHNLRGPTSNLKSLLHFYGQEETVAEKDMLMDKFQKTVHNLEGTLNELLDVVSIRHESKKEREELNFETVLERLIDTYQGKIMETNAKITYDFSAIETVEYSSVYLESIMHNLLSNAIKYKSSERDPAIHFVTGQTGEQTSLTVSDNGLGIDMEKNGNRLFGLHKTFHKHPEAKGVGLFITKAQVEAMGGEITAESEVDKGTTFSIIF